MSDFDYIRMPIEDSAKEVVDKWWEIYNEFVESSEAIEEMEELIKDLDIQITANQIKS